MIRVAGNIVAPSLIGSVEFAARYAEGIATAAHESFRGAFAEAPPSEHKEFLRSMTQFMVERRR